MRPSHLRLKLQKYSSQQLAKKQGGGGGSSRSESEYSEAGPSSHHRRGEHQRDEHRLGDRQQTESPSCEGGLGSDGSPQMKQREAELPTHLVATGGSTGAANTSGGGNAGSTGAANTAGGGGRTASQIQ